MAQTTQAPFNSFYPFYVGLNLMDIDHVWAVVGFCSIDTPGRSNFISYIGFCLSGIQNCNFQAHTSAKHNPSLAVYQVKALIMLTSIFLHELDKLDKLDMITPS